MSLTLPERLAILDVVEAAIVAQGEPSIDADSLKCLYRYTPAEGETRACVIGQLICDNSYGAWIDSEGGLADALDATGLAHVLDDDAYAWFENLQGCHDRAAVDSDQRTRYQGAQFVARFQQNLADLRADMLGDREDREDAIALNQLTAWQGDA